MSKLTARSEAATDRANKIATLLCGSAHRGVQEECPPFAEQWNEYTPDGGSKQQLGEWIQWSTSSVDSPLSAALAVCCSGAALLRLSTGHIRQSQQQLQHTTTAAAAHRLHGGLDAPALSEETVDQVVRYAYAFLQANFLSSAAQQLLLNAGAGGGKEGRGASSSKGGIKGKGKENLVDRAVAEVVSLALQLCVLKDRMLDICFFQLEHSL